VSGLVVDTSAAVAILTGEEAGGALIDALDRTGPRLMSAGALVELGIVLEARFGPVGMAVAVEWAWVMSIAGAEEPPSEEEVQAPARAMDAKMPAR